MFTTTELKAVITAALARGYCSDKNADKVLDVDLIESMAHEVAIAVDSFLSVKEGA